MNHQMPAIMASITATIIPAFMKDAKPFVLPFSLADISVFVGKPFGPLIAGLFCEVEVVAVAAGVEALLSNIVA